MVLEHLGLALVDLSPKDVGATSGQPENEKTLDRASLEDHLIARIPHLVQLGLYKEVGTSGRYHLDSVSPYWVCDDNSLLMTLPVYGEQHKIDLAFNGDGLLETAAISDESRAAAVLAAVKRAPAQVAAGANAATKVAGALGTYEDYAKNRQIAELQLRQQQLTLQVADGTLESDAATAAEREKIANLLAELQNQQKIDALYEPQAGTGS